MKNFTINNKNLYAMTIAIAALLCCMNASMITTNSADMSTEPDINFYGTLEDHVHTAEIQSILIGGRYESIPVYQHMTPQKASTNEQGHNKDIDPKQNKILINLQDIKSIALEHPHNPTSSSIQVNNKTYIQIVVESLHGTKKKYLVEATRKITCKEIDKSADINDKLTLQERDINFIHVKKLTLKGFKSNHPYQAPSDFAKASPDKQAHIAKIENSTKPNLVSGESSAALLQEKDDLKNNAAELLHAIEENVKNLPMDNPSAFETMRSTILTLLKSLRDQLQKFLDMIK
ncbi:MAG: hypothetical protein Q8Q60_05520 [Candidatus Chromulinivorax sp.]|nr:hypothetical protein [Candidatus Chromulinivorax sp.]